MRVLKTILGYLIRGGREVGVPRFPPLIPTMIIFTIIIFAVFGDFIVPHDPYEFVLVDRMMPPAWMEGGTWNHVLGTDLLGRDTLSRIIIGSRISLSVAVMALALGGFVGVAAVLAAAYYRGWVEQIIMRVVESIQPLPAIFIGMIIAIVFGPSYLGVISAMAFIVWARYARSLRGEVLSVIQRDFVDLARVAGASPLRIMVQHILPNITNTLMVLLTLMVGWAILVEATLSFLGAGIPPPAASWGRMVSEGRDYVSTAWWISVIPGTAVFLAVLAFNIFGDWLRDRLDPKLRQV